MRRRSDIIHAAGVGCAFPYRDFRQLLHSAMSGNRYAMEDDNGIAARSKRYSND